MRVSIYFESLKVEIFYETKAACSEHLGYIAVLAVAIQTGIIMVEFIRESLAKRAAGDSYIEAVIDGSVARLRPKLMTVATLIPIMLATGSGMDVTKPIAAPSVGGMVSSTVYVLFLIPCLFAIGEDLRRRRASNSSAVTEANQ